MLVCSSLPPADMFARCTTMGKILPSAGLLTCRFITLLRYSVVRACKWGDGDMFATASDPFTSRDYGFINVYRTPVEGETELERKYQYHSSYCDLLSI